jgi:hypothetical protein
VLLDPVVALLRGLHLLLLLLLDRALATRRGSLGCATTGTILPGDDVDEEVEHIALTQGRRDIAPLESPPLVILGVDPGAHSELGDEDVTPLGEEDGGFSGDHLDFGVGFHDFFDAREGELVDFEVVRVGFEVVDCLLPVRSEDVPGDASETLVYLGGGLGWGEWRRGWFAGGYVCGGTYVGPKAGVELGVGDVALRGELWRVNTSVAAGISVATILRTDRKGWISYCCACACDISLAILISSATQCDCDPTHHNGRLVICHRGVVGAPAARRSLALVGPLKQRDVVV